MLLPSVSQGMLYEVENILREICFCHPGPGRLSLELGRCSNWHTEGVEATVAKQAFQMFIFETKRKSAK